MTEYFKRTKMVWDLAATAESGIKELSADFVSAIIGHSTSPNINGTDTTSVCTDQAENLNPPEKINHFRQSLLSQLPYIGPYLSAPKDKNNSYVFSFILFCSNTLDNFINACTAFGLLLGYLIAAELALVGTALAWLIEGAIMGVSVLGARIFDTDSSTFKPNLAATPSQETDVPSSKSSEKSEKENRLSQLRASAFQELGTKYGDINAYDLLKEVDEKGALSPVYIHSRNDLGNTVSEGALRYVVKKVSGTEPHWNLVIYLVENKLFKTFEYALAQHKFLESQQSFWLFWVSTTIPPLKTVLNKNLVITFSGVKNGKDIIGRDLIWSEPSPMEVAINQLIQQDRTESAEFKKVIELCLDNGAVLTTANSEILQKTSLKDRSQTAYNAVLQEYQSKSQKSLKP